jgi:fatty acid desaturase
VLALQTGISSYGWVLHHNFGHHVNYLNQRPHENADESHWTRADGSTMGRFEYSVHLFLHHQFDIVRVGRKHPRYLRYYLWMKVPLWTVLGVMFWFRPLETALVFWLPSMLALFETTWVTYEHHAGCEGKDHHDGSHNRINSLYNVMTGNLGYHTAHHTRPGLHWSLLPELHEKLGDGIPDDQISHKFW